MRLKLSWPFRFLALGLAALGWWLAGMIPDPARPALWQIEGPNGARGWLFGTIHALPHRAAWHGPKVDDALAQSDRLVVEVAGLNDDAATARTFAALAHTPGLPPLDARVPVALRPALAKALAEAGRGAQDFTDTETWAAALILAQASDTGTDTGNGIDRALLREYPRPIVELEGAQAQLSAFDQLPEPAQRDLLNAVIAGTRDDDVGLAEAWRRGDMATIAAQTRRGILAAPSLRQALYTARNRRWAAIIEAMMRHGQHPFVTVGAAHMAGDAGLPVLLAADGWRVRRIQ